MKIIQVLVLLLLQYASSYLKPGHLWKKVHLVKTQRYLLTESFDSLKEKINGTGKAKIIWENLRNGLDISDKSVFETTLLSKKTYENMISLLRNNSLIPNQVIHETTAACGTRKMLLQLVDGMEIETVLIPSSKFDRTTLCVSTQVGCDRGCAFCRTGKMGLIRNLTGSEIIGQVIRGIELSKRQNMPKLSNVVFMGMGDAGRNLDAVREAVHCLTDTLRLGFGRNKVTVSTVCPDLDTFDAIMQLPCTLAWSLHSPDEAIRRFLVPSTRHTPVQLRDSLLQAVQNHYHGQKSRTLMIAITLIEGINDRIEDAQQVASFVQPIVAVIPKIAIDLIPYNDIQTHGFSRPSRDRICAFQRILREAGYFCSVRLTRGDDEQAACGMLATSSTRKKLLLVHNKYSSSSLSTTVTTAVTEVDPFHQDESHNENEMILINI